ncbi:MAG TPA: response regulator transcription factor [Parafilimonas sp.]|nr:response regulator transcription factor [Parafilimonas sp.]
MSNTIKMVIADDHSVYLEGLHSILHSVPGISIVADAINGDDLVKKAAKFQPDIVLTDITMPVKNGIVATRELLKHNPAIGVIALTVSGEDTNIVDMLEAGASGYLLKNSAKQEIIEAIQTVYGHGTYYCKNTSRQLTKIILKSRFNPFENANAILSDVEVQVIKLICQEKTSKEIAHEVHLSDRTIEAWRARLQEKLKVRGTAGIVVYAIRNGIFKVGDDMK